ncbi:MAG: hypothetical protein A2505_00635 [Deltaproteobacteria bacterium RIFOXYD12_FULL_55_16]|nr:MAG: hypothetical protein A2505_00635 [Deltaproteobacteria bacterium RIFOXYD12_FULL_55_16]
MVKVILSVLCGCLCWVAVASAAVNINTATVQEISSLHGIGPAKAQAIVDYRQKNGPFKSAKDLDKVKGIGPMILKKLGGRITVAR